MGSTHELPRSIVFCSAKNWHKSGSFCTEDMNCSNVTYHLSVMFFSTDEDGNLESSGEGVTDWESDLLVSDDGTGVWEWIFKFSCSMDETADLKLSSSTVTPSESTVTSDSPSDLTVTIFDPTVTLSCSWLNTLPLGFPAMHVSASSLVPTGIETTPTSGVPETTPTSIETTGSPSVVSCEAGWTMSSELLPPSLLEVVIESPGIWTFSNVVVPLSKPFPFPFFPSPSPSPQLLQPSPPTEREPLQFAAGSNWSVVSLLAAGDWCVVTGAVVAASDTTTSEIEDEEDDDSEGISKGEEPTGGKGVSPVTD